jgi:hypothetical protein
VPAPPGLVADIEPGAGNSEPYEFVMLPGDVLV